MNFFNQKLVTKFSRVSSSFVIFYERCDVLIPLQVLTTLNAPRFYNDVLYMDGTLDVEGARGNLIHLFCFISNGSTSLFISAVAYKPLLIKHNECTQL